eukprot:509861_1
MGPCTSKPTLQTLRETAHVQNAKETKYVFTHTKHYERYFNRHFKVSVCAAKGERKRMEDQHLCQFTFSNHENYSLFGIFDGHNGSEASQYLSDNLYTKLNSLPDLDDNQAIITAVEQLDQEYITNTQTSAGSTIVFALTYHESILNEKLDDRCDHVKAKSSRFLPGFEDKHSGRVFWCGDARAYLVRSLDDDFAKTFVVLTDDHNTDNPDECERVMHMGGRIMNHRVDGKLRVTRAFGDKRMKYEGSPVICKCECKAFEADRRHSLLLSCDGLTEKWSDEMLMNKFEWNWNNTSNLREYVLDTAKVMGGLVDDAIMEGSDDNISVMLIQFTDGRKHQMNQKYENVL